jgi:hypothetical protein
MNGKNAAAMSTLTDYLPKLPEWQLVPFQQLLIGSWLVISLSWGAVSTFIVLMRGGSLFSDDPECATLPLPSE